MTWEEIKPLSDSGVTRAIAAATTYNVLLNPIGFSSENWVPGDGWPLMVDNEITFFFAVEGVLFYTLDPHLAVAANAVSKLGQAKQVASNVKKVVDYLEKGLFETAEDTVEQAAVAGVEDTAAIAAETSAETGGAF